MTLIEFVLYYGKKAYEMHSKELEETFHWNQGLPSTAAKNNGFLKHATSVTQEKFINFFNMNLLAIWR